MTATNTQKLMKHFKKWAEDKNPTLALLSLVYATSSQELHQMIHLVRKGKRIEGDISLPKLKTWLQFYKSPKQISKAPFNLMSEYDKNSVKLHQIIQRLTQLAQDIQNHPEKLQSENGERTREFIEKYESIVKTSQELIEITIQDLHDKVNETQTIKIQNWMKAPEAIFFFRVQAPCFFLYGTYPHLLLEKAQNGDDKALEKLIRLDKSIIFEPKISEIIHQAQGLKAQAKMDMIQKAFSRPPKANLSRKKVKCLLGGYISYVSGRINLNLKAAEIRKLFDAIALDQTGDIDQDLGNMVGVVFEKAIQRSRKFWIDILPDKK